MAPAPEEGDITEPCVLMEIWRVIHPPSLSFVVVHTLAELAAGRPRYDLRLLSVVIPRVVLVGIAGAIQ